MKSKHQTVLQYLDALQHEYFEAELRRKIHHSPKEKRYWGRVMDAKREKIEDIVARNELQSIFTDEDLRKFFHSKVFSNIGGLSTRELKLYYSEKAAVRVQTDENVWKQGEITECDLDNPYCLVRVKGNETPQKIPFSKIKRVF